MEYNKLSRELRKNRGWSQYDLARALGTSRSTISHIETGRRAPADVLHLLEEMDMPQQQVLPLVATADEEALRLFAHKKKISLDHAKIRLQKSGYVISEKNDQTTISSQPARLVKMLSATAKTSRDSFEECRREVTPAPPVPQPAPSPPPTAPPVVNTSVPDPSATEQPSEVVEQEPADCRLTLSQVNVHDMLLHAVKIGENQYEVTIASVCAVLGLKVQPQIKKLLSRSWAAGRVSQRDTLTPSGTVQSGTHMIDLDVLMMWLATINENNVDASKRPGLILLQKECAQVLRDYFATGAAVNTERFSTEEILERVDSRIASVVAATMGSAVAGILAPFMGRMEYRMDEIQLQVTQGTQRAVDAAVANLRTDFRLETPGVRGRYLENGTDELYINMTNVELQLLEDPDIQREALQHGCALEGEETLTSGGRRKVVRLGLNSHISGITKNYVETSDVWVGLKDVVPLDRNNEPKVIPQQIYNKKDIANIKEGVIAWARLGFCEWRNREFMVNGQPQTWPYPNLDSARKLLKQRGFSDVLIDNNIKLATAILRFPGVPVQPAVSAGGGQP